MSLRRRWLPSLAILIVLLGMLLTAVLVRTAWRDMLRDHQRLFDARADAVHDKVLERIKASDINVIGRNTQGVRVVALHESDSVVSASRVTEREDEEPGEADQGGAGEASPE